MEFYTMPILNCLHADTCLPDYWSGHHLAHLQITVFNGMTLKEIKQELRNELNQGAISGNEPLSFDDSGIEGDKWFKRAHAAINRIKPSVKGTRRYFKDLEQCDEDGFESVSAFFVFDEA
jgi:hypothetical protein